MTTSEIYQEQRRIALKEFRGIVADAEILHSEATESLKLRLNEMRSAIAVKSYTFKLVIEEDPFEDGRMAYFVSVPALPGCHSWAYTKEEALENIHEAIQGYIETLIPTEPGVIGSSTVNLMIAWWKWYFMLGVIRFLPRLGRRWWLCSTPVWSASDRPAGPQPVRHLSRGGLRRWLDNRQLLLEQ